MGGDENQKASVKFRSFNSAGILLHHSRKSTITTNYRNSREILKAAYSVFEQNSKAELAEKDEVSRHLYLILIGFYFHVSLFGHQPGPCQYDGLCHQAIYHDRLI